MSSAKAHPYLVSYGKLRLIEQDPITGHYGLGPFALQLGLVSLQLLSPLRAAIPAVTALGDAIGHTVAIAVLGTNGPTIVYIHESRRPIHVNMRAGTVMSTVNTATGRVFSAYLPPKIAQHYVARELRDGAVTAQASSRMSKAAFDALVSEVRERGLARAVGEPHSRHQRAIRAGVRPHARDRAGNHHARPRRQLRSRLGWASRARGARLRGRHLAATGV